MSLSIYNSLSRRLEVFSPIEPGHVRMYVCGMTVYDLCHLGHARSMLAFDVVQRWLKASGYRVTYVRNVTDIDDKIIARAVKNGETITSLTDRMIDACTRMPMPWASSDRPTSLAPPSTCRRCWTSCDGWKARAWPTAARTGT
jgi:cysteinyl-tRNA synthetase